LINEFRALLTMNPGELDCTISLMWLTRYHLGNSDVRGVLNRPNLITHYKHNSNGVSIVNHDTKNEKLLFELHGPFVL